MLLFAAFLVAKDAMLGFLIRGLTAEPAFGAALFDALTAEARRPSWYVGGEVPDTLDGRFAVLATITALALVRFEREGEGGNRASVALTERFIEVMESEHRELGLGDPTLGRTVRRLVGMLARRTELWRSAGQAEWNNATRESLYRDSIAADALEHSATALRDFSNRLEATPLADLEQGTIA
ncbi:MAG: cytochrome b pre-mRNA-processing protein 3 [Sphingomonadales bacterium]|nr:cytochrome b pre-mRNA-processing protein 3 [Sphingomonadales bacterium]